MLTIDLVTAAATSLIFGLLFILTALRLLSEEKVVFHSVLSMALGLVVSLTTLLTHFESVTFLSIEGYELVAQAALLAFTLSFGALTLDFIKTDRRLIINYWIVAGIIFLLWVLLTFDPATWGQRLIDLATVERTPAILTLSVLNWTVGISTALVALTLDFRRRHPTQYLNRLRYWVIATALLTVSGLTFFFSPTLFDTAGLILLTAAAMLAGYLVLSYHTPDLRELIGRSVRYAGVMFILFALYFLSMTVVILTERNLPNAPDAIILAAVLAILLANLTIPIWRLSRGFLTQLVFGKQQKDEKQLIQHYSRTISSALDMSRLGDIIVDLMIETLGIEHGAVFTSQRTTNGDITLRPLSSVGLDDIRLMPGTFITSSPFIDYFRQDKKIVSQYDVDVLPNFRPMATDEKQWLSRLNMELYVPIMRERELIGLLGFGQQGHKHAFYDEDRELMVALANQAALAMDSARLFEQLAIINQEVGLLTTKLAGLDQGKSDFLSIASHELRTPLTHIHGYSRMLLDLTEEELSDPAYVKTIIEGIAKGSERMKGVIDVMFDVTEADVGEMNLFTGEVILEEVLEMATRPFLTVLDERRIAFGKSGIKDLPPIEADGTRLVQALENLIGNAIKYTPDGGIVTVQARCMVDEDIGSAIEIAVIDTGIGIDTEHHQAIFEKFFRVDDTDHHSTGKTKFKGGGPGLGLTLVKAIADAHGGKVWVESLGEDEVNHPGSKFFLVIPMAQPEEGEKPSPPRQSQIETRHWRLREMKEGDRTEGAMKEGEMEDDEVKEEATSPPEET